MEHRYVGGGARKYKRFDVAHAYFIIKLLVERQKTFYSVSSGNNWCSFFAKIF